MYAHVLATHDEQALCVCVCVCVHAFQQLMINRLTGRRQVRKGTTARSISSSHIFVK